jgi:hypothetical protein
LGGVRRYTVMGDVNGEDHDEDDRNVGAEGTKLGVHQFFQEDALTEPQKKAFSAIDESADQILMGILLEYVLRMGVDTRIVSIASSIRPWEDIRWLTAEETLAWNIDNTHRHYTDLTLRAFQRPGRESHLGAYVEVSNVRSGDSSYLRIFCQTPVKDPLFTFITVPGLAPDRVASILSRMNIELGFGSDRRSLPLQVLPDVQGVEQKDGVRVFALVRAIGFARPDAERLTRVALVDNGGLGRSDWTFQDSVKFRIQGDHRLIGLAMKNCVD